ncbi:MAG: acyl carrier protein [Gammaproteobacteria bacterium]|jgi:acyl carrier protein|nr:acyl carrier protein [Gammaproteobacteria bacterium]
MDSSEAVQDTRERMRRIIINYLDSQDIHYQDTNFDKLEEIGIDSLGMLDVIFEIEGEFGVQTGEIDSEVLEKITTFDGLVELVESLKA